jgi:uncharacterized protein YegL
MKTLICLILDRSGSMGGRESDVIGGVNKFIKDQQGLPDPASITFVRFDSEAIERFRGVTPIATCEPLKAAEYQPRGGTPLLDAVGQTINGLDTDWARERPERCIVVIVTDGQENASREFTKEKIQSMIKSRELSGMWSFIYLGANIDAFDEAAKLGVRMVNTAGYVASPSGISHSYATMSNSVKHMRSTGSLDASTLGRNLGESDEEDDVPPLVDIPKPDITDVQAWSPPA